MPLEPSATLPAYSKGPWDQIVMGRVPSSPRGSSGFQFQPVQHFLDNNQCNARRNIQILAAIIGFTQAKVLWKIINGF